MELEMRRMMDRMLNMKKDIGTNTKKKIEVGERKR